MGGKRSYKNNLLHKKYLIQKYVDIKCLRINTTVNYQAHIYTYKVIKHFQGHKITPEILRKITLSEKGDIFKNRNSLISKVFPLKVFANYILRISQTDLKFYIGI